MFEIIATICVLEGGLVDYDQCSTKTYVKTYDTFAECELARTGNPYVIYGLVAHLYENGIHNVVTDRLECFRAV
jgi:hypothetical protein